MTGPEDADRIDQVLYRWAKYDELGGHGFGPVKSSFADDTQLRKANDLLKDRARVDDTGRAEGYSPSLCFVRSGGQAAVVWRSSEAGSRGDPLGHALVGARQTLTARSALSLHGWPGWGREAGRTLWHDDLAGWQGRAADDLTRQAQKVGEPLAVVVATRLRQPQKRLGVVIPAEQTVLTSPTAFLWGMLDVLAVLWDGGMGDAGDPTFSTHEPDLIRTSHNGLLVVMAPREAEAGSSYGPARPVVRPHQDTIGEDEHADRARQAVEWYQIGGPAGLREWWAKAREGEPAGAAWGRMRGAGRVRPAVAGGQLAAEDWDAGPAMPPAAEPSPADRPDREVPVLAGPVKLIAKLRKARSRQETWQQLRALESAGAAMSRNARARLRRELVDNEFCVAELGRHLRGEDYRAAVRLLVKAAADADLDGEVDPFEWQFLAYPDTPELVVRTFGDYALDTGAGIAEVALWRGMRGFGDGVDVPEPGRQEVMRLLGRVRRRRRRGLSVVEYAALAMILLAIAVMAAMVIVMIR